MEKKERLKSIKRQRKENDVKGWLTTSRLLPRRFSPRRRSPRLISKVYFSESTSMQDLRLLDAGNGNNKHLNSKGSSSDSNLKEFHVPIIKLAKNNSVNERHEKQSRALKRMRDISTSLKSIENVMPAPLKKLKPSRDNELEDVVEGQEANQKADQKIADLNKKSFVSKVAQFARGFSPRKSFKKQRSMEEGPSTSEAASSVSVSGALVQRSSSLRLPKTTQSPASASFVQSSSRKYKEKPATPTRRRGSKLWVESLASFDSDTSDWTPQQIKRQEAIYELYCGETDLVEDIKLLQEVYFNPISKLKLLSEEDLASIFGNIQALLPLHEDLVKKLEEVRSENGSIEHVGKILMDWIPTLRPYIPYCANQLQTKDILFQKLKENEQFSDFLERCQASPFSRKLDLWSFLDAPRGRLVKYPLLVSNIHKYTPKDHSDRALLYRTQKQFETHIKEADREAGISKCAFYKERLFFMEDNEYKAALDDAATLICHGCLKNKSGSKFEAFLFDTVFLCTRLATRSGTKVYHVFNQPILVDDMEVADISDGEIRLGGSFRTTVSKGAGAKNAFRVFTRDWARGKTIILQANDQHDKKQWLNAFHSLLDQQSRRSSDSSELVDSTDNSSDLSTFKVPAVKVV